MKTPDEKGDLLVRSVLAVLVERDGGEVSFTQSEFMAVGAKHGQYLRSPRVDRFAPGESLIRVKLESSSRKQSMPVS